MRMADPRVHLGRNQVRDVQVLREIARLPDLPRLLPHHRDGVGDEHDRSMPRVLGGRGTESSVELARTCSRGMRRWVQSGAAAPDWRRVLVRVPATAVFGFGRTVSP